MGLLYGFIGYSQVLGHGLSEFRASRLGVWVSGAPYPQPIRCTTTQAHPDGKDSKVVCWDVPLILAVLNRDYRDNPH